MLSPSLTMVGGLAVWDWPGAGPPLVFAHATGFHGRIWDELVRMFPGRRALAPDLRWHGRSFKRPLAVSWKAFGEDIASLEVSGAVGIGHSMGGHAIITAAAMRPEMFAALILVDPVVYPPDRYRAHGASELDLGFIERRRVRWDSPAEMFERFRSRAPFATWRPETLRAYCDYALLPVDGAFELACAPATEAALYRASRALESNPYRLLPGIEIPVTVIRAGRKPPPGVFDLSASFTWEGLAACFPRGREVFLPDRNHFIPMEAPELVAAEIAATAAEARLSLPRG